jgi:diguanylate cyclase (GGDEF)-like protein
VSTLAAETLFDRIQQAVRLPEGYQQALIPIEEATIFYLVANEIVRAASKDEAGDLLLIIDAATAAQLDAFEKTCQRAARVVLFGEPMSQWRTGGNLEVRPLSNLVRPTDLFVLVISSSLSLAVVCTTEDAHEAGAIHGGWTNLRNAAADIAETIAGPGSTATVSQPPASAGDEGALHATHLMALMAEQLTSRQRDIAMDKDDLFCVLNILKAISAKRRAHDILYVFVEQVARVIGVDRCSVVRVWSGDPNGHVLASHEDASVRDVAIDLEKYPEIRRAMELHEKVVINDAELDPITRKQSQELEKAHIASLIVIPIVLHDQQIGSLFLRAARRRGGFNLREVSFFEIVAEAAANALERAHLFESIQRANERLERLAVTDGLTGLNNHRFFRERLEEEFQRAKRYRIPLSCLIMDVDNFKKINDTFGHLQGDSVLKELSRITMEGVRASDTVARYGGEELVVIMPQTGWVGARAQGERLRASIAERRFKGLPEDRDVTVSIGVAVYDFEAMADCEAMIGAADMALYEAKRKGKNQVVINPAEGDGL